MDAMPGRIMQRKTGLPAASPQQACEPPSGEENGNTFSYLTGCQAPFALISSRPVSGLMRYATGRQSRSLQQDMPSAERSPVYHSCALAGTENADGTTIIAIETTNERILNLQSANTKILRWQAQRRLCLITMATPTLFRDHR